MNPSGFESRAYRLRDVAAPFGVKGRAAKGKVDVEEQGVPPGIVGRAKAGTASLVVLVVAPDSLVSTGWAPLDVAARDVKLAGYCRAVVARARFSAPVVGLAAVGDAGKRTPTDGVGRCLLGGFETLRPVRKDSATSE
jgi:hypothetical protein